jgi:capsular exopolysaccharide synthesis family protein
MNSISDLSRQPMPRSLADLLGVMVVLQVLRRRMLLMAIAGGAAAVVTLAFMMLRPPVYTATALLMVTPRAEAPAQASVAGSQASSVDAEVELLRSPALINQLAAALGMQNATDPAAATVIGEELSGALEVRRRNGTFMVEIRAHSAQPERAQVIANTYADVYIASQLNMRANSAEQENALFSRRLAELRADAQSKAAAAEAFRIDNGLDAYGPAVDALQPGSLYSQMQQAQAELASREARQRQIESMRGSRSLEALSNVLNSETLNNLRMREADIVRRQTDLESRYLPTHPALQAVRAERRELEAQIQREIRRTSAALEAETERARTQLQSLQQTLRPAPRDAAEAEVSNRLRTLQEEAAAAQQVYETYLQRAQQSVDQAQFTGPTVRLLTNASLPVSPSSPRLSVALALALGLGLLFAAAAGAFAEFFDHSVKNTEDLEQRVGHPAIASIPTISKRLMQQMPPAERHPASYLVSRPMSAFTEALRVLRTVVVYSKLDFSVKVVAITSAMPNEGKTTIAMCLARVAAMSGQRVCVVDCDLRKQSINDVVDVASDVGILQVLAGEASWRNAIVQDPISDLHVLPVAASGFTPRDVFGSDSMSKLVRELRAEYDLVILDCAPILAVAETRILVAQADTTVLVACAGRTPIGAMRAAASQTEAAGGNVLGIALNYVLPRWQTYADALYFSESKSYYSVS